MEARGESLGRPVRGGSVVERLPLWALGLIPLVLIMALVAAFFVLDGPGLGGRTGAPIEELAIERTVLRPGTIELHVRNDGPDPVAVRQVIVNDAFTGFDQSRGSIGRLEADTITVRYPWIEGEAYEIALLTSSGATIDASIEAAAETPARNASFLGLMVLLGLYVGIIPVTLGMLWLPFVRRIPAAWVRVVMAFTVGLLAFLAIDATLEGFDVAGAGAAVLGGAMLVPLGALAAYLALSGVDAWVRARQAGKATEEQAPAAGTGRPSLLAQRGAWLALLVAIGIGLHNLGEGLAIGSAYAVGALALGAFLVVGFAIHNTTEGLAIVAPLAQRAPSLPRLLGLGLIAGAPAILGALIGASAYSSSLAAFLLGVGAGAIVQVAVQIAPAVRDPSGRLLYPASVVALLGGLAFLYVTSLLVS